jgi:hypothetical protein
MLGCCDGEQRWGADACSLVMVEAVIFLQKDETMGY